MNVKRLHEKYIMGTDLPLAKEIVECIDNMPFEQYLSGSVTFNITNGYQEFNPLKVLFEASGYWVEPFIIKNEVVSIEIGWFERVN